MYVITALRDRVADRFLNINLDTNDKTACRGFVNALVSVADDLNNPIVANPEDFDLMKIGDFDEVSGRVVSNDVRVLMTGIEVFNRINEMASSPTYNQGLGEDDEFPFHAAE